MVFDALKRPGWHTIADATGDSRGHEAQIQTEENEEMSPEASLAVQRWVIAANEGQSEGLCTRDQHGYERLYTQLVRRIRQTHASQQEDELMMLRDDDWARDRAVFEYIADAELLDAVHSVAVAWSNDRSSNSIQRFFTLQTEETATATATAPPLPCRQSSMAEKLARMRTQRSLRVSASPKMDGPPGESVSVSTESVESPAPVTRRETTDDAAHYFAIETRLALKERLQTVQKQLPVLLVQLKLAWMKCFAAENANSDATTQATELVTQGEALAKHLLDACTKAQTTGAIQEYKQLVATVEDELQALEALVTRLSSTSPSKPAPSAAIEPLTREVASSEPTQRDIKEQFLARVQLDRDELVLPSMKAYYAKVAPPYAAYLAQDKSTRQPLRSKKPIQ
ncbi:hypothetical protein Poli38472_013174 [Pythium oligandrum]|uniref:Uncharacterized protein n=1 Tax=Pythium oligandrum TaxID=41045 RepID=A0A8K1C2Q0_PYTOL|nr:hypothetical protein Poli38472_013174 [Pythium oligandrum]|eukprot:TMW55283.1 hypothetical protein Poli38472_013174 [Pythium oligandrum]